MDDIYREIILDHYKNPRNFGEMENPDTVSEKDNPLCGDEIKIQIKIQRTEDPKIRIIKDIKFSGQGCAISIASTSMLTEKAKGAKIEDLLKISKDDIVTMLHTKLTPARIKCATLPLEVIHNALIEYEKKESRS